MGQKASRSASGLAINPAGAATAVPAASIILGAPNKNMTPGFRVLMVKRASTMKFMPNAYVFPGGKVDADDIKLSRNTDEVGMALPNWPGQRIAALRELGEEVGLSIERTGIVYNAQYTHPTPMGSALPVPFAHWVTPAAEKKRFDTIFFAFEAQATVPDIKVDRDPSEIADIKWITPKEALRLHATPGSGFRMPPPTLMMMHQMSFSPTFTPVVHENYLKYHLEPTALPRVMPILIKADGVLEMHVAPGVIHLPVGTHNFPCGEEGGDLRVHVGSPRFFNEFGHPKEDEIAKANLESIHTR